MDLRIRDWIDEERLDKLATLTEEQALDIYCVRARSNDFVVNYQMIVRCTPAAYAARHGRLAVLKVLPRASLTAHVNQLYELPLHMALASGDEQVVAYVLAAHNGAFASLADLPRGRAHASALYFACVGGNVRLMQRCVDSGGAQLLHETLDDGDSMLHGAALTAQRAAWQWLRARGVGVRYGREDWTCVHEALKGGNVDFVEWLLDAEPELRAATDDVYAAVACAHAAAQGGHVAAVRWAVAHDGAVEPDATGSLLAMWRQLGGFGDALCFAAGIGAVDVLRVLVDELGARVDRRVGDGTTAVYNAALHGELDAMRYLAARGASLDVARRSDGAGLDYAAACGGDVDAYRWAVAARRALPDAAPPLEPRLLLTALAACGNEQLYAALRPNAAGFERQMLYDAAAGGSEAMAAHMERELGLAVDALDNGLHVMHAAAFAGRVELMQRIGAWRVKRHDGYNVLHSACFGGKIRAVEAILDALSADEEDAEAARVAALSETWATSRVSCLHTAVQRNSVELVRWLLARAPFAGRVDAVAANGFTPLLHACESGECNVVAALVAAGADARYRVPNSAYTPVLAAARGGNVRVFAALGVEARDELRDAVLWDGRDVAAFAAEADAVQVLRWLAERHAPAWWDDTALFERAVERGAFDAAAYLATRVGERAPVLGAALCRVEPRRDALHLEQLLAIDFGLLAPVRDAAARAVYEATRALACAVLGGVVYVRALAPRRVPLQPVLVAAAIGGAELRGVRVRDVLSDAQALRVVANTLALSREARAHRAAHVVRRVPLGLHLRQLRDLRGVTSLFARGQCVDDADE